MGGVLPGAFLVALLVLSAACGGTQRSGGARDGHAIVHIECEVGAAEVIVNDRPIRRIDELRGGLALSPGRHRIEVRHDRYHSRYFEITVGDSEQVRLEVELAEILP